ncbi:MAG: hypothetical protein JKY81_09380 [Colwellia sp.]|nr:hypothetical protein [Colwellia sp.]
MNRLIIVAGASGAGKSFLLEHLYARDKTIVPIKKLSTRPHRTYEKNSNNFVDLHFNVKEWSVKQCEYHYKYENEYYGIQKEDIDYVLERGSSPIIVVRNPRVVKDLMKAYPSAFSIYLQNILSGSDLKKRMIELGRTDIDIEKRSSRTENDYYDYCNNPHIYDYVILNKFDAETFLSQYESILEQEERKPVTSKIITFITDQNYDHKYKLLCKLLRDKGFGNYNFVKFTELLKGPIVSKTVSQRLRSSYLTIIDVENDSSCQMFYQGYLKSLNKSFVTLIKKGTNVITVGGTDTNYYEDSDEMINIVEEKLEEYLERPFEGRYSNTAPLKLHLMEKTVEIASKSTHEDSRMHPYVGAILVDNDFEVILTTYRGGDEGNGEHAEYRLLTQLEDIKKERNDLNLSTCTLFVSLEPCTARGKGKVPCAERVIASGIGKVVVGMLDPDINIRSRGVQKLRAAGIYDGEFPKQIEDRLRELNKDWIRHMEAEAQSVEGV